MNRNSWIAVAVIIILIILGVFMFRSGDEVTNEGPNATSTNTGITTVRPYGQVTLRIGETAAFRGISITPLSVTEDSRCAQGVQCVQAGTVRTTVESELGSGATRQDAVSLNSTTTVDTFRVSLVRVEPAAEAGETIANSDYRLTFEVRQGAVADNELIGK